jgi:extracellular elastinolytic metalloproteinase
MSKHIDTRQMKYDSSAAGLASTPDRFAQEATRLSAALGHELKPGKVNPFTGHVTDLKATGGSQFAAAAAAAPGPASDQAYVDAAMDYVRSVSAALGFAPTDSPAEFVPDPNVKKLSNAAVRTVNLRQHHRGVPVWDMELLVWLSDGVVERVKGDSVSLPPDLDFLPAVTAEAALKVAAAHVARPEPKQDPWTGASYTPPAIDLSRFEPKRLAATALPNQPMVFEAGPFAEAIPADLVYVYRGPDTRLAWRLKISLPAFLDQYIVLVEADSKTKNLEVPTILYCASTSHSLTITGSVFTHNPGMSGGAPSVVPFPRSTADYLVEASPSLPPGFPHAWTVAQGGHLATIGNNTVALNGSTERPVVVDADVAGGGSFVASGTTSPDQFVINIFYFCNFMHDFFLMLGFTEEAGNFQTNNPSGVGKGTDPVRAFAHPVPVDGTANMLTRADGVHAIMNMGLVNGVNRHTAVDSDVVFHEFVHGVTNRLVGGMLDAEGLREDQSRSMGEGWSDYFALSIPNFSNTHEKIVTGDWVTGRAGGIRMHPYDPSYPGKFGNIGSARYVQFHNVGEIWCATLMQMTRNFSAALGKQRGYRTAWQAVVDGLKLTPKNPSFLVARDAVLRALRAMRDGGRLSAAEHTRVTRAAWQAFAAFDMGVNASCPNASFFGCNGDSTVPPDDFEG